jgi:hypothetical protein
MRYIDYPQKHWDLKLNDIIKLGRIRLQLCDFGFMKDEGDEQKTELLMEL